MLDRSSRPHRTSAPLIRKIVHVPDGGGWRYLGCPAGDRSRIATAGEPRNNTSTG